MSLLVLPILSKVEMYAPNEVPGRMTAPEEFLNREFGFRELGMERRIHSAPEIGQHICCQVFRADHGRNGRGDLVQFVLFGNGYARLGSTFGYTRKCAERSHIARSKLPPIRQHRRKSCSDFIGA